MSDLFSTGNDVYFACTLIRECCGTTKLCTEAVVRAVAARCDTEESRAMRMSCRMGDAGMIRTCPEAEDYNGGEVSYGHTNDKEDFCRGT